MARMKALKSFRGDEGSARAGREFDAKDSNAADYERAGLAVRVKDDKRPLRNKIEPPLENKAAQEGAGPLAPPGGEIGEAPPQSSLPLDRAPLVPAHRVKPPRARRRKLSP